MCTNMLDTRTVAHLTPRALVSTHGRQIHPWLCARNGRAVFLVALHWNSNKSEATLMFIERRMCKQIVVLSLVDAILWQSGLTVASCILNSEP